MSVGDVKGSRRRLKIMQQKGQAPRPKGMSVAQMIDRNRKTALNMSKGKK